MLSITKYRFEYCLGGPGLRCSDWPVAWSDQLRAPAACSECSDQPHPGIILKTILSEMPKMRARMPKVSKVSTLRQDLR